MDYTLKEGTVVSVPTYSLHRDESVWGPDAHEFNPERWFADNKASLQRAFGAFSLGPRYVLHYEPLDEQVLTQR